MPTAVLLIESNRTRQALLTQLLEQQFPAWQWRMADCVADARAALEHERPDLALVAHRLEGGTAFDLREQLLGVSVILMVSPGDEAAAAKGMREGFTDYVVCDEREGFLHPLPGQLLAAVDKSRLESALKESATLAELALEGAGLGFWQRNLLTNEAALSRRWLELLGGPQGPIEASVAAWLERVHPDDRALVNTQLEQYLRGDCPVYEAEYRIRQGDNQWIWVASRGRVMEWTPEGQPMLLCGTYMDVTARHQVDEAVLRQHRLLKALSNAQNTFIANVEPHAAFDGLLQALLELTGAQAGCLGEVVFANPGVPLCLLHASSGELPHGLNAAVSEAMQRAENSTRGTCMQLPADLNYWHAIPIVSGGRLAAYAGLNLAADAVAPALDELKPLLDTVSQLVLAWRGRQERRQAQDQLREATEMLAKKTNDLELTLDTMTQGISNVGPDGRIQVYNRRYLELLDLPESLLASYPKASEVVRFQVERGDFGVNNEVFEPSARDMVDPALNSDGNAMPQRYLLRGAQGQVLEVDTRWLPSGGRVRTFTDVTAYMQAQEALRASEERWRSLSALSSDWYWEQDEHFRFTRVDGRVEHLSGSSEVGALGKARWEIESPNVTDEQWAEHRRALEAHEVFVDFEIQRVSTGDGETRWVSLSGEPIYNAQGVFKGYRGIGRDITEKKNAEAIIERLAFYDELTSLPNRRLLLERLTLALKACGNSREHGALLFLDLDNFKDLNDTLGHDRGDHLLTQVATRLVSCARPDDTVARLGGDEFVVILAPLSRNGTEAAQQAETVAYKILGQLNQPYPIGDSLHHSTPSIGIALFNDAAHNADELLKRGDLAMYQAKAAGRNTVCFFDPGMQAAVTARSAMEADLRQALQRSEFRLLYQPVVDGQGHILGAEALLRWSHPQRGSVSPAEFIPVAEKTGLILPLGRWVLQTACRQLVQWAAQPSTSALTMSVNVSAREFRDPGFVEEVLAVLGRTGARPSLLKLELTESLLLNDVEDIIAKMTRLKMQGVGFSLDDFGTGYSSLSYLKRLPLDQLKIDQSFVRDVLTDPNDATIARTIITLGSSLGLSVVAEGVETSGQLTFLQRSGCGAFQGYFFSRPVPAMALAEMLGRPLGSGV